MFKSRSKVLFASSILTTLYIIYLLSYFSNSMGDLNSAEDVGGAIATALVTPHMALIALGVIFSWVGFTSRKPWAALVAAILYCVGAVMFLLYIVFCVPLIILGFIGYSNQRKLMKI